MTIPLSAAPLKALYLSYKNESNFAGNETGGKDFISSSSTNSIPNSVVLEMIIFISGLCAHLRISFHSDLALSTRLIEAFIILFSMLIPFSMPLTHIVYRPS